MWEHRPSMIAKENMPISVRETGHVSDAELERMEPPPVDAVDIVNFEVIVITDDDIDDPLMYENPAILRTIRENNEENEDAFRSRNYPTESSSASNVYLTSTPTTSISKARLILYTPLQKWQYERGLCVDGVTDVGKWAAQVGLVDGKCTTAESRNKMVRPLVKSPPKYGETSEYRLLKEDNVGRTISEEERCNKLDKEEEDSESPLKGKNPLEE
ncbi:hypothetical protein M758_UG061400 [Ceratodon purpureus]|nr:hypothetical protein M758_UG061400 [Ceratodon purpureus]